MPDTQFSALQMEAELTGVPLSTILRKAAALYIEVEHPVRVRSARKIAKRTRKTDTVSA
jgi:deoxyinosine 3'endonuclease (endonuclease V)